MDLTQALEKLIRHEHLMPHEMASVMRQFMQGKAHDAQIGAILTALRMKSETVEEITEAVKVMRELVSAVDLSEMPNLVDTCGTGGDGASTFNISTASAFVVAAAGGQVAKHGNRSFSSKSGSADVLEAAGVNLNLRPDQVATCVRETGVGFMFAPAHHNAMKHVIGARKAMGIRTLFNLLGPLTNPAGAPNQVIGVFNPSLTRVFAEVLRNLGSRHVMAVAADDGLDEISVAALTRVCELKDGQIHEWTIDPYDYDMDHVDLSALKVDSALDSLNTIRAVFANSDGAAKDIVCLNAGAAIYTSGLANSFAEGVQTARKVLADGAVAQKFDEFIRFTQGFASS